MLDYVICPKCLSINAAMWFPHQDKTYEVICTVCGYRHERGEYEVQLALTHEEIEDFFRSEGWAILREEDHND